MSYCRRGEDGSDVYVYDCGDGIICHACSLGEDAVLSRTQMVAHLEKHRRAGHSVPEYATNRLRIELKYGDKPIWDIDDELLRDETLEGRLRRRWSSS